jgi:hypothetical protein
MSTYFFWISLKLWNLNFLEIQIKDSSEPMCQNDALVQLCIHTLPFFLRTEIYAQVDIVARELVAGSGRKQQPKVNSCILIFFQTTTVPFLCTGWHRSSGVGARVRKKTATIRRTHAYWSSFKQLPFGSNQLANRPWSEDRRKPEQPIPRICFGK